MKSGYRPDNPNTVTVTVPYPEIQHRMANYKGYRQKILFKLVKYLPEFCAILTGGTIIGLESISVTGYPLGSQSAKGKYKPEDVIFVDGPILRQHLRKYFKPHNPRTPQQVVNRDLFRQVSKQYKALSLTEKEQWDKSAKEIQPGWTGINLYMRTHL